VEAAVRTNPDVRFLRADPALRKARRS